AASNLENMRGYAIQYGFRFILPLEIFAVVNPDSRRADGLRCIDPYAHPLPPPCPMYDCWLRDGFLQSQGFLPASCSPSGKSLLGCCRIQTPEKPGSRSGAPERLSFHCCKQSRALCRTTPDPATCAVAGS